MARRKRKKKRVCFADLEQFAMHFQYEEVGNGRYRVIGAKVDAFFNVHGDWRVGEKTGRWGMPLRKYLEDERLHDSLKPMGYPYYLSSRVLMFGKHKGERLTEVPTNYLKWMGDNMDMEWGRLARAVLKYREWMDRLV